MAKRVEVMKGRVLAKMSRWVLDYENFFLA